MRMRGRRRIRKRDCVLEEDQGTCPPVSSFSLHRHEVSNFLLPLSLPWCVVSPLDEKCLPYFWAVGHLVSSWCHCLRRFRRCSFVGGSTSLEAGFESLRLHPTSRLCSLLHTRQDSSSVLSAPDTMPAVLLCLSLTMMDSQFSGTTTPNKPFLLQIALVMVFCCRHRKVTNVGFQTKESSDYGPKPSLVLLPQAFWKLTITPSIHGSWLAYSALRLIVAFFHFQMHLLLAPSFVFPIFSFISLKDTCHLIKVH